MPAPTQPVSMPPGRKLQQKLSKVASTKARPPARPGRGPSWVAATKSWPVDVAHNLARLLGTQIIVVGVGIFGTFTGYLANLFLSPGKKTDASSQVIEP